MTLLKQSMHHHADHGGCVKGTSCQGKRFKLTLEHPCNTPLVQPQLLVMEHESYGVVYLTCSTLHRFTDQCSFESGSSRKYPPFASVGRARVGASPSGPVVPNRCSRYDWDQGLWTSSTGKPVPTVRRHRSHLSGFSDISWKARASEATGAPLT